ncbi:MAG: hypothetical protein ACOVQR_03825 [Flavobacterium sp.]|uniref:hypothetical protein n=1 Tax=Flavobacterium sp. TaxID=239 RepID=UPI003BA3F98E
MTRQLIISTFFLATCLTGCGQTITNETTEKTVTQKLNIDTSTIAIINLDSSTNNTFKLFKTVTQTELTLEDLEKIEMTLVDFLNDYNPKQEKEYNDIKEKNPNSKIDIRNFTICRLPIFSTVLNYKIYST